MAAVTIHSDFGAQEEEICHYFHLFPFYLPCRNAAGCHGLRFFLLCSLKLALSLCSFTLIKRLFSSSSLSAIRVVSSASPGVKPLITFRYHRRHKSIVLNVSKIKLIISTKSDLPLVHVSDHNDYIETYPPPFPLTSTHSCSFPTVPNVFVIPHRGHDRSLLSFVSSLECLVHSISRNIFYLFFIGG